MKTDNLKLEYILRYAESFMVFTGIKGLKITAFCKYATISKKTFYSLFQDKDQLIICLVNRQIIYLENNLQEASKNEAMFGPYFLIVEYLFKKLADKSFLFDRNGLRFYPEAAKLITWFFDTFVLSLLTNALEKGVKTGLFRNIDIDSTAEVFLVQLKITSDHLAYKLDTTLATLNLLVQGLQPYLLTDDQEW